MEARDNSWSHRSREVVSLSLLIEPAAIRMMVQVQGADDLTRALALWLGIPGVPQPELAAGALLTYRQVAVAGLMVAAGLTTEVSFEDGVDWLERRQYFVPHLPPGLEADPAALLALSIALFHVGKDGRGQWLVGLVERAMTGETDSWRVALLRAAQCSLTRASSVELPGDLQAALWSRGIGTFDPRSRDEVRRVALSGDSIPPERAALRLAALRIVLALDSAGTHAPQLERPSGAHVKGQRKIMQQTAKVLFLAASPQGMQALRLDTECREIQDKIRAASYRDQIQFMTRWAVRRDDLLQALNEVDPTVLHFSGHGEGAMGLCFEAPDGTVAPVSAEGLSKAILAAGESVKLVVLNACYSDVQAAVLRDHVPCIIGMSDAIPDESAIIYAASFYRALAFGRSVKNAHEQGLAALAVHQIPPEQLPQLIHRKDVDPAEVRIVEVANADP